MDITLFRARLISGNINNPDIEIKFNDTPPCVDVEILAGSVQQTLGNTKDVLFMRDDKRGSLPFLSVAENGSVSFNYVVSKDQMSELNRVRNKIKQLGSLLKENRGLDVDELVKLEYELPNSYTEDFKALQGQHKRYFIVIDVSENDGGSMSDMGFLQNQKNYSGGEITITCLPYAYGINEMFGYTDSPLFAVNGGTMVGGFNAGDTTANYIINPSFSADILMDNWTYNPAELDIKRLPEAESLLDNDILVTSLNAGSALMETSITGEVGDFHLFALVKRADGGPVTALDAFLTLDGLAVSTSYQTNNPYNEYKMLYISFNRLVDFSCGLQINNSIQLIVVHLQLSKGSLSNTHPFPNIANGDLLGFKWEAAPHASKTLLDFAGTNEGITYKGVDWLENDFTFNIWFTPLWDIPMQSLDAQVFKYNSPYGSFECNIISIAFATPFVEVVASGGSFTAPITIKYNGPIMFTILKGGNGAVKLFINGVFANAFAIQIKNFTAPGNFVIGRHSNAVLDGFKILDTALSQESVAKLYTDELAIKEKGESVSNGVPSYFAYPGGIAGSMDGKNDLGGVSITSKNAIALLGSTGDGAANVLMRLKSVDNINTNRLVTTSISLAKQARYYGNWYIDFAGSVAPDPNTDYSVNMSTGSLRTIAGVPPQNSLQSGETWTAAFSIGGGGQAAFNEIPIATQRPWLINGDVDMMVRFLHIVDPSPPPKSAAITSRPVFSYGGPLKELYQVKEIGDVWSGVSYALLNYGPFKFTEKNFPTGGNKELKFGMRFNNAGPDQSFVAIDIIHLIQDPKVFLYELFTATNQTLIIETGKQPIVEKTDGFTNSIGGGTSSSPLVAMPNKYIYIPFDFSLQIFNDPIIDQSEQIRKRVYTNVWLKPTYKF